MADADVVRVSGGPAHIQLAIDVWACCVEMYDVLFIFLHSYHCIFSQALAGSELGGRTSHFYGLVSALPL